MRYIFFLRPWGIVLVVAYASMFSSCAKKEDAKPATENTPIFAPVPINLKDSSTYYFVGELEDKAKSRTIALQGEMTLKGTSLEGKYHYQSGSGVMALQGSLSGDGTVTVNEKTSAGEFSYNPDHKEQTTAIIRGKLDKVQGIITGSWVSSDGKVTYPCTLKMIAYHANIKHPSINVSVSYPVFSAPDFAALNDSITRIMRASFDSSVKSVTSQIAEIKSDTSLLSDFKPEERLTETDDLRIHFASGALVSMTHLQYFDGGGAHGNYGYIGETWQKRGGAWQQLRLKDLFTSDTAYYKRINDLLISHLKKRGASFVADGSTTDLTDGLRVGSQSFVIHPAGITFLFSPYAVASYAEGEQEVFIPWKALKDFLRKDGAAGEFL